MTTLKDKAALTETAARLIGCEGHMKACADAMQSDPKNAEKIAAFNKACNIYRYAVDADKAAQDAANGVSYD